MMTVALLLLLQGSANGQPMANQPRTQAEFYRQQGYSAEGIRLLTTEPRGSGEVVTDLQRRELRLQQELSSAAMQSSPDPLRIAALLEERDRLHYEIMRTHTGAMVSVMRALPPSDLKRFVRRYEVLPSALPAVQSRTPPVRR